ncbi:hypothetical protein C8R44DRAFT_878191 [Mycena epipterygia]|nr:hypothetical protein C8R44DRAFT_878191 [Mycena epipterygia]
MSAGELFKTAVFSKDMYGKVAEFLDFVRREGAGAIETSESGSSSDEEDRSMGLLEDDAVHVAETQTLASASALSMFPVELILHMMRYMDIEDRQRFAQASRACCAVAAQSLQHIGAALLRSVDLPYDAMRLMQVATGSLFTGALVVALLQFHSIQPLDDIDIVTAWGEGRAAVEFIEMCSEYKVATFSGNHEPHTGIDFSWTLIHARTGRKLHVSESTTANPVDAIVQSLSSCVVGGWGAEDVWHGYPALTRSNMTICTAATMPIINGLAGQQHIWSFLHRFAAHNLQHSFGGLEDVHGCGVHHSCPATLRTTDDAGLTAWKRIMNNFMATQTAPTHAVPLPY